MNKNEEKLRKTLNEVMKLSGKNFSGVGVIIYENINDIPIFPLRETSPDINENEITESIIKLSSTSCQYHDGFHLISKEWQITHISQYFSPPILEDVEIDMSKLFGGRYIAALFGSSLPNVLYTGIASRGFGQAMFQSGKEIYYLKDDIK